MAQSLRLDLLFDQSIATCRHSNVVVIGLLFGGGSEAEGRRLFLAFAAVLGLCGGAERFWLERRRLDVFQGSLSLDLGDGGFGGSRRLVWWAQ